MSINFTELISSNRKKRKSWMEDCYSTIEIDASRSNSERKQKLFKPNKLMNRDRVYESLLDIKASRKKLPGLGKPPKSGFRRSLGVTQNKLCE